MYYGWKFYIYKILTNVIKIIVIVKWCHIKSAPQENSKVKDS